MSSTWGCIAPDFVDTSSHLLEWLLLAESGQSRQGIQVGRPVDLTKW